MRPDIAIYPPFILFNATNSIRSYMLYVIMNHLELFSGTHSFGKSSIKLGYNVVSLDRDLGASCPFTDYVSQTHIQEDILTWDYTQYPVGHFKLITASPVCTWWSNLRRSWIGRKLKAHGDTIITSEIIDRDIELYGVPMVDKMFEIINYFNPEFYIIENPKSGRMKDYISDLIPYYDISYCMYGLGYRKETRFWTNITGLQIKKCNHKKHKNNIGAGTIGDVFNKIDKYRIPNELLDIMLKNID